MKKIEEYVRSIPDFPEPGIIFRDVTSVIQDADGLQLAIDFCAVPVFFAVDCSDFEFQLGVRGLGFVEQFFCDVEIFTQRHCGTVPHV